MRLSLEGRDSAPTKMEQEETVAATVQSARGAAGKLETFFGVAARAVLLRQAVSLARATQLWEICIQVAQELRSCSSTPWKRLARATQSFKRSMQ